MLKKKFKPIVYFWAVLLFFNALPLEVLAKCPTRMGSVFRTDSFLVIASRGASPNFPENTIPAFEEALNTNGANALEVDLSLTEDKKLILWHDWDPNSLTALSRQKLGEPDAKFKPFVPPENEIRWRKKISKISLSEFRDHYGYVEKSSNTRAKIPIPTFQDLMHWATQQGSLKAVLLKLKVPEDESHLAPIMLKQIREVMAGIHPSFQLVFLTPHKNILNLVRKSFDDFIFSYDREIPPAEISNFHEFTTIPSAMDYENSFASLGLPIHRSDSTLDPWITYRYILTLDFRIRDTYINRTSKNIKIISWTFNDEKKMRCLINLGVDGIVTDNPKTLRRLALEMGKVLH
jgi:glycerophosphoryl diester phosphodiesterase